MSDKGQAMIGAGALFEALDCIGNINDHGELLTDHDLAKVIVDNQQPLRALCRYALERLAEDV